MVIVSSRLWKIANECLIIDNQDGSRDDHRLPRSFVVSAFDILVGNGDNPASGLDDQLRPSHIVVRRLGIYGWRRFISVSVCCIYCVGRDNSQEFLDN